MILLSRPPELHGKHTRRRGGGEIEASKRARGTRHCSWLERSLLPGMLGGPRGDPQRGRRGWSCAAGGRGRGRGSETASQLSLLPGCRRAGGGRCRTGAGGRGRRRKEGAGGRASERPRKMKASIHPSIQAASTVRRHNSYHTRGERPAGDGGRAADERHGDLQ